MKHRANKLALAASVAFASSLTSEYINFPYPFSIPEKRKKAKCKIPTCENLTSHKKGYCSATCFKASKV